MARVKAVVTTCMSDRHHALAVDLDVGLSRSRRVLLGV